MLRALATVSCFAFVCACSAPQPASGPDGNPEPGDAKSRAPNIIVILADDLGYADVSTYFPGRIPTPNIDRIGQEGVVFEQGYVTAPICSPSRAGLMTGRYQQRFGFEYNNGPPSRDVRDHLGLDVSEQTIANILGARGYTSAVIGKWHLGASPEHYPLERGFDYFWGFLTGQTNFIRPDAPDAVNGAPPQGPDGDKWELERPAPFVAETNKVVTGPDRTIVDLGDGYLTEQLTTEAVSFIDRNKDRPFFLYLAHAAPHTPLQTTTTYYDRFPEIGDKAQRVYAGMVSALDDSVGHVLDEVDALGLTENTIVIFLSDNGCAAYVDGICSAEPLSGGKLTYLEGGIRVPFLMRWPAKLPAGTGYEAPVSSLDILPTLALAAGADLPSDRTYDGTDIVAQVEAGGQTRATDLFWRTTPMQVVRTGDWKYYVDKSGREFLYDISTDPTEETNLVAEHPEKVELMKSAFAAWETDKVDPAWAGRAITFEFGGRIFEFSP